ncbi:unnamed protein product [Protopolystoma xenopodis]|uniref:Phosphatase tensin-type domain-containing protein n=1 Tax=Protopolystoma xenopodis TaxID=117903 RepID=A0A3S4ZY53_9PLAT|nr:unnamed protein product [Protopolystoma xenopodis]
MVQSLLDTSFLSAYAVYNLSPSSYHSEHWFGGRVSHRPFEANRAPSLRSLVELCLNARLWLSQSQKNVCIIHCTDGRNLSAIFVCALLLFCGVFDKTISAIRLFTARRGPPCLTASQIRPESSFFYYTF